LRGWRAKLPAHAGTFADQPRRPADLRRSGAAGLQICPFAAASLQICRASPWTRRRMDDTSFTVQLINHRARGYRNRDYFRIAILLHCGGLDVDPC
jgi:hypothetical protein